MDTAKVINKPYLAVSLANFMLFGITCSQMVYYFRSYPGDDKFLRAVIAVLFILEGVHLAFLTQAIYDIYIVYKVPETAFHITLGTAVSITITFVIASTVQSFYAWRVSCLSTGNRWKYPFVAFILATSLAQFCQLKFFLQIDMLTFQPGTGLTASAMQYGFPSLADSRKPLPRISYSVSLTMTIICDLTISACLVHFLNRMRTGFRTSENVINRLIYFSMGNGLSTSIIAICALVAYYIDSFDSLLYTAFIQISAKFYVNSMLVTLNSRTKVRQMFVHARKEEPTPLKELHPMAQQSSKNDSIRTIAF